MPISAELLAAIAQVQPVDDRERAAKSAFLRDVPALSDAYSHEPGAHITASAIVVNKDRTLLHLHKRLGIWLQPGGHVDAGEEPSAAVVREVWEETGLTAQHPVGGPRLIHLDVHEAGRGHVHYDLRYLVKAAGDPRPQPGESPEVRWFSWADALHIADAGLSGALRVAEALSRSVIF